MSVTGIVNDHRGLGLEVDNLVQVHLFSEVFRGDGGCGGWLWLRFQGKARGHGG